MKNFIVRGYLLRNARSDVRWIYTGFLLFVAVGLVTVAAFQLGEIGWAPSAIARYYRGGESAGTMTFPKTFRELVEVTHFHAFIMGTVYLIVAHLYVATEVGPRVKTVFLAVGFTGLLGDLVLPWAVRYGDPRFAWGLALAWAAEWTGFAAYLWSSLREMWFPHESEEFPPE